MFNYPIAISLSPNTDKNDVQQSVKVLLSPGSWKTGARLKDVKDWFSKYLNNNNIYLFNSGRSALFVILQAFGIGAGDEVLIQPFTCVAVPNSVIWTKATPKYIDIDESLNIDPRMLEKAITNKTKAIIVQHTFGIAAKIDLIKKIAQKHKLILIEDCAHSIGTFYKDKKIGTYGDAAIFSFGRDKVISSVAGGLAVLNTSNVQIKKKFLSIYQNLPYPSYKWIFQQIFHPLAFSLILPLYNLNAGKLLLVLLLKLKLLDKPVYAEEMTGRKPQLYPAQMPNALARLLILQLSKLNMLNDRRKQIARYYFQELDGIKNLKLPENNPQAIYLRFNILSPDALKLFNKARKEKILLGKWYRHIIDPKEVDYGSIGYKLGSCPKAENASRESVNLPTYHRLTEKDLNKITKLFKS